MNKVVRRISIPNPFFEGPNSVYLIEDDPLTLVDTGIATDQAYQALCSGLREHGIAVGDVQQIVLTHKHIDHLGNAWRIQNESGAEILIHESEHDSVSDVNPLGNRFAHMVQQRLADWGVPEPVRPTPTNQNMPAWKLEPAKAKSIHDGQSIDMENGELEVVHTPGHTLGSICLRYNDRLFTGDHVLPDTTPNVGGGDLAHQGLLQLFLNSLDRLRNLEDELQVLPGHGAAFWGLAKRCDEMIGHHQARLAATLQALRDGAATVFEVAQELFGEMDGFHVALGCAEANAHLEFLMQQGSVAAEVGRHFVT